jgi:16S rRNA (guanine527-N7)-methyltransferase
MDSLSFVEAIKANFENVNDEFFKQIEVYKNLLQNYNQKTNLTRLADDEKIYKEFFFDSLIHFKNISMENKKILDIGSGNGAPGIILKLLFPSINLTVMDSNKKKIVFMNELCNTLNIKCNIILKRAEEIQVCERETYDIVTSRAVSELKNILEISTPYCVVNGLIIEPKGSNYKVELSNAAKIIKKLDIVLIKEEFYNNDTTNVTLVFTKKTNTNLFYPRK